MDSADLSGGIDQLEARMESRGRGISDAAVLAAMPPTGWVRDVVEYGQYVSDAPAAFWLAAGLSVYSLTLDPSIELRWGGRMNPCVWSLVVGPSGHSRKTSATGQVMELLSEAYPDVIGRTGHESVADLVDSIAERPRQILYHAEFGDYLSGTSRGSYKSGLREKYLQLWDGTVVEKSSRSGGAVRVENPRVGALGAVAPGLLEKLTTEDDWTGGFMSRWLVLLGHRTRDLTPPPSWPDRKASLVEALYRGFHRPLGTLTGLDPEAASYMRSWSTGWEQVVDASNQEWLIGLYSRMQSVALKVAMTVSVDVGAGAASFGRPWLLDAYSVHWGCQVAELHMASATKLVSELAMSPYAKQRRSVLMAVGHGQMRSLGTILRTMQPKMPKKSVEMVIDSLVEDGSLFKLPVPGHGTMYTTDAAVLAGALRPVEIAEVAAASGVDAATSTVLPSWPVH